MVHIDSEGCEGDEDEEEGPEQQELKGNKDIADTIHAQDGMYDSAAHRAVIKKKKAVAKAKSSKGAPMRKRPSAKRESSPYNIAKKNERGKQFYQIQGPDGVVSQVTPGSMPCATDDQVLWVAGILKHRAATDTKEDVRAIRGQAIAAWKTDKFKEFQEKWNSALAPQIC